MNISNFLADVAFSAEHPEMIKIENTPNFNVVRVSLNKGLVIPPHPEPNGVVFIVLQGAGTFTKGEESAELKAFDSIYIEANEIRGIVCKENIVMVGIRDID